MFTNITKDMDFKAVYSINEYTVRFYDYDDELIVSRTVEHGSNVIPPTAPPKEGYTFSEWVVVER